MCKGIFFSFLDSLNSLLMSQGYKICTQDNFQMLHFVTVLQCVAQYCFIFECYWCYKCFRVFFLIIYKPVLQVLHLSSLYSLVDFYSFINPGELVFIYGSLHTQNQCRWSLYVYMNIFTVKFMCFEHVNFTRGKFP